MDKMRREQRDLDSVRQAQALADKATRANEAKSDLLTNISHEMRTPLNGILGVADMLADDDLPDVQRDRVNIIIDCGRNLLNLVNDILDSSKIESGNLAIRTEDCSLAQILNSTEAMLKIRAQHKGIAFEVKEGEGLPATLHTDPMRVQQCLVNLAGNAIKFTHEGHVHINVSLMDNEGKAAIRFDVEDTGIGIRPEQQQVIFEPFAQAEADTTRRYGGTGLGLSITRQLIDLIQGKLLLTSEMGKGSVFSMIIPAGLDVSQQPPLDRQRQSMASQHASPAPGTLTFIGKVLVAEDVNTNKIVIQSMLDQLGVDVTVVADGQLAVQKVREDSFDLILMDINMPNLDGFEATRMLREEGVKLPIIALTASVMEGDEQRCLDAGCDGHLCKPVDRSHLYELVSKYLPARADVGGQGTPSIDTKIPPPAESQVEASGDTNTAETGVRIINWQSLIDRLRDEEIIKELLPTYLKDNEDHFSELTEALASKDLDSVARHAHAICGAGRNLGALQLSDVAKKMETAGRKDDLEKAKTLLPDFKQEIDRLMNFMAQPEWMDIAKRELVTSQEE